MPPTLTCIDRGGTFTDVIHFDSDPAGRLTVNAIHKFPSDRAVMGDLVRGRLVFGTTVATNALLERRGVPTAVFVTAGLADILRIRDQRRPELFDPDAPTLGIETVDIIEVTGRFSAEGTEVEPLLLPDLPPAMVRSWRSAAIVLLHGSTHNAHERRLAEHLRAIAPHLHIVCGHEIVPSRGYLARLETTWVDAAITPILQAALNRDRIPTGSLALRSDGSLVAAHALRAPAAILSGPAGGVLAVAAIAAQAGLRRAIGFDMGGTSTDVCCVDVQQLPMRAGDLHVAGVNLRTRMLEVATIAAGGGSVLASDGIRLTVGPASAGADPGPQAYGRGGPPTLTDAAIAAGLLNPATFPFPLHPDHIALPGDAAAFIAIARESMAQAISRLAMQRGLDPRDHALVAFGGAGPQHAAGVADLLGIDTVVIHPAAPVLCAWGAALAVTTTTHTRDLWLPIATALPDLPKLSAEAAAALPVPSRNAITETILRVRERGSDHGFDIPWSPETCEAAITDTFDTLFAQHYGFQRTSGIRPTLEIESLTLCQQTPTPEPPLMPPATPLVPQSGIIGPHRLELPWTTLVIPAGWRVDSSDDILLLKRLNTTAAALTSTGHTRTQAGVELWQNRFQALADEAGTVLARLGHSVNIRERWDFSCAIFDTAGRLVANAPHVPVHLGAMGDTVRDLLEHHTENHDLSDGMGFLTNDPCAGGSHLPDLTVITVVVIGSNRFFVANRAHHADIGGLTPGSMPPHSTTLADEGLVFRRVPLVDAFGTSLIDSGSFRARIAASRQPALVLADLEAQLAANHHMAAGLRQLGSGPTLMVWMDHLRDAAREAAQRCIANLRQGSASDDLDGVPLHLTLRQHVHNGEPRLEVDFTGTGGPHPGNLNAPRGVVRAAILYALRVLIGHPMPLNEGVLEAVTITTPLHSIVSPPPMAAVVGGNVETSQRLVDLFFMACGHRAESQGTMNNLSFGGDDWSSYETIGGGCGASAFHQGASARQVHMTNTRATDPEVLESRLPLRLRRVAIRPESGGTGRQRGGDGLVREIELTRPATATLLAAWREDGARGLEGGGSGATGHAQIDGVPWNGEPRTLAQGSIITIETPGGGGFGSPDLAAAQQDKDRT